MLQKYTRAADQGNAQAQAQIGHIYMTVWKQSAMDGGGQWLTYTQGSYGVNRDYTKALEYLKKAAAQMNSEAQVRDCRMGCCVLVL